MNKKNNLLSKSVSVCIVSLMRHHHLKDHEQAYLFVQLCS